MSNSTQNDEIEVDGETYVKWDTQNDEVKQMEKAINEGFAESERDLKDKKTPLDQPTQNDWEKRYEEFITFVTNEKNWIDGRPVWKEYKYVTLANAIKYFIRKELADARREVIEEIENKLESIQFVYEHQWTDEAVEKLCERCGEVIKIGTPCEASIHITCWKLLESVLATLRKEES
jgi:hypothetical protein